MVDLTRSVGMVLYRVAPSGKAGRKV